MQALDASPSPSAILAAIDALVPELRSIIFGFFSFQDLAAFGRVCLAWYFYSQQDRFWLTWIRGRYGLLAPFDPPDSHLNNLFAAAERELYALHCWNRYSLPATSCLRNQPKSGIKLQVVQLLNLVCPRVRFLASLFRESTCNLYSLQMLSTCR